ncbi:flagellar basal body L-ring protein FlgH [Rosenbergiella australiborealis]|uniref:Flagellar L-ring protein n=1 Tax=Rosenbergiella australiborealis TaxID=1544696 RepID=A0ABS5T5E5_9GAMM|nr:flagellar basal body L-ring protein FlgH [Rosenbergiella australiborealis]MBT0727571.1 flagellar basal body L-ring protein FlgH [Rosenbergiella australiborealis]
MRYLLIVIMAMVVLLTGCESSPFLVKKDDEAYAPPDEALAPEQTRHGGGVFTSGFNWSITQDRRAYRVGDILTVKLDEATQASKQAKTGFDKKNDTTFGIPNIFGHSVNGLSASVDGDRTFNGNGSSQQQNSLKGFISVAVYRVLANGVLVIRGEKWLTLNQGDEYIRITGLVRADDIDRDNSVNSQRIANARISYAGRGALSDANSAGWLTRFFNHPLFPM